MVQSLARTRALRVAPRRGFTLLELLVVIGIISALTGILLLATSAARREARAVRCQANIRELSHAVSQYCGENKQKYPPNLIGASVQAWFDPERVGGYLPSLPANVPAEGTTVWACPEDDGARRSYAMNYWASSKVDFVPTPPHGKLWGPGARGSSQLLLLVESWSNTGSAQFGYGTKVFVGASGEPAKRFGALGGLPPFSTRSGPANAEVTFARHRRTSGPGVKNEPIGRTVIAFADGHVELLRDAQLVNPATGKLTGRAVWSPSDL